MLWRSRAGSASTSPGRPVESRCSELRYPLRTPSLVGQAQKQCQRVIDDAAFPLRVALLHGTGQPFPADLAVAFGAPASGGRQRNHLPATVIGVGSTADEALLVEAGQDGGHRLRPHPL